MFQMDGEHSTAMVSLAVRRATLWGRKLQFTSLAVDLPSGERLLLKGPSSSVVFQGYTKLRWQLNLHSCLECECECECYIMYVAIITLKLYMWQTWGWYQLAASCWYFLGVSAPHVDSTVYKWAEYWWANIPNRSLGGPPPGLANYTRCWLSTCTPTPPAARPPSIMTSLGMCEISWLSCACCEAVGTYVVSWYRNVAVRGYAELLFMIS